MGSRAARLSLKSIEALKPGEILWDTDMPRFGARCRSSGTSYFIKPRIGGRQRWITIGRHGPLTPAEARAKAKVLLGTVDAGQDPTRERDARRILPTLDKLAELWLAGHVALKRRASTHREYRRIVYRHIIPPLGHVRVDRISRADVMVLHEGLAETRYAANRVVAVLSALLSYAERLGHRQPGSNPCKGVERYAEKKRKRPLTADELGLLWHYLNELDADGRENHWAIAALKLLMLTGCRKSEVLTLRWTDVDFERGILWLRDGKTGDRDVVLSKLAQQTLAVVHRIDGNPFVICGARKGARLVNLQKPWRRICVALGFQNARIHDLRHSVASALARTAPFVVVRDALGHRQMQTTSGYSHAANDDVRRAVDDFAKLIVGAR
jgi:integrase